jgi:prepilin-type N-terminal cleavage/methylation domain-containing protein
MPLAPRREPHTGLHPAFTLVELMVVLALLVLAALSIIPSALRFEQRAQLSAAARRTLALAAEARSLAVTRETTVTLAVDEETHALTLEAEPALPDETDSDAALAPAAASTTDDPQAAANAPIGERQTPEARTLPLPVDVHVTLENRKSPDEPALRFYADGRADLGRVILERDRFDPIVMAINPRTGRLALVEEQP